ncbi:MAG: hypothetical protein WBG17_01845, partial [Burkholderiaceae bacterium]
LGLPKDTNDLFFCESLLHVYLHVKINMKTHPVGGYTILSRSAAMTNEHAVPENFPQETLVGSLAGSSPKLLLRKVGDKCSAGLTPDELYQRYAACEDLAQQLAIYTQRKIDTKGWDFDDALRRVELGIDDKVRSCTWNFSDAEISWLMSRTRQIMTDVDSRTSDPNHQAD